MARPGVTYHEVSNIAEQLVAAGKNPTIDAIRIALGTGSNSTLGAHLRTWKERADQSQQVACKEKLPSELVAALKGVWERVMDQADEKIQAVEDQAQAEVTKLNDHLQSLQSKHNQLEQQSQTLKQENDLLANEKAALTQLLGDAKTETVRLAEKVTGLTQQNQEKQTHIEELNRQNQQIQENLEHYRAAALEQRVADQRRFDQQLQQIEYSLQKSNQELAQAQQEKLALQQQNQQMQFENKSLQSQLNQLADQHSLITANLTHASSELVKKTQEQEHWQREYTALEAKWNVQSKALLESQNGQAVLSQQVHSLQADLKDISEQNKLLAQEKWQLGQEKAQLFGQLKQLEAFQLKLAKA